MTLLTHLPDRGVIEIAGQDRVAFLQGLVSNDVALAAPGRAIWAALLTPQGKWLADFFILADDGAAGGERLLLDCARAQTAMLVARLTRHRLRAKVTIADRSADLAVAVAWGGPPPDLPPELADARIVADPRLPEAGFRILSPTPLAGNADPAAWDRHRLSLGLPEGAPDLEAEKSVLLEAGFDELNGISWTKGCYMGQELTARTRYRGLVKRRLVPVAITADQPGDPPAPGTPVLLEGAEIGTMRSAREGIGLAVLRLEALRGQTLSCGAARLTPRMPGWMRLPEAATASS